MEETTVGSDVGGVSKVPQGDLVTTSLSFLLVHLKIDGTAWAPSLSSAYIASMSLMQVQYVIYGGSDIMYVSQIISSSDIHIQILMRRKIQCNAVITSHFSILMHQVQHRYLSKNQSVWCSLIPSYAIPPHTNHCLLTPHQHGRHLSLHAYISAVLFPAVYAITFSSHIASHHTLHSFSPSFSSLSCPYNSSGPCVPRSDGAAGQSGYNVNQHGALLSRTRSPGRYHNPSLSIFIFHSSLSFLPSIPPSHSFLPFLPLIPPSHSFLSFLHLIPPSHSSLSFLPLIPPSHSFLSFLHLIDRKSVV